MQKRKRYQRLVLTALALFLTMCQPLTALAAERAPEEPGQIGAAIQITAADPMEFMDQLSLHTDNGKPWPNTTRGQYVTLLYEAVGSPTVTAELVYPDVPRGSDCAVAVTWAHQAGILDQDESDYFRPEDTITEEEANLLLSHTLSALGNAAQQIANSILAAYTGRVNEEDWALTPSALLAALDDMFSEGRFAIEYPIAILDTPPGRQMIN